MEPTGPLSSFVYSQGSQCLCSKPQAARLSRPNSISTAQGSTPKPLQPARPIPQAALKHSIGFPGCGVGHCSAESAGGNSSRLPTLGFGAVTFQGGSDRNALQGWAGDTAAAAAVPGTPWSEQHLGLPCDFRSARFLGGSLGFSAAATDRPLAENSSLPARVGAGASSRAEGTDRGPGLGGQRATLHRREVS